MLRSGGMRYRTLLLVGTVFLALSMSGCVPRRSGVAYVSRVDARPPAPYLEVVTAAPGPNYVWVNGYWTWIGNRYVWMRGHWAPRPGPGYVWVNNGWTHVNGRYRFVPGRWVVGGRRPAVRYVHPVPRVRVRPGVRYRTVRPAPRGRMGPVRVRVRPR